MQIQQCTCIDIYVRDSVFYTTMNHSEESVHDLTSCVKRSKGKQAQEYMWLTVRSYKTSSLETSEAKSPLQSKFKTSQGWMLFPHLLYQENHAVPQIKNLVCTEV